MVVVISVLHPENKDVYIGMLYTDYRHTDYRPGSTCQPIDRLLDLRCWTSHLNTRQVPSSAPCHSHTGDNLKEGSLQPRNLEKL